MYSTRNYIYELEIKLFEELCYWTSATSCVFRTTAAFSDPSNLFLRELKTFWHTQYARYIHLDAGKLNIPIVSPS